MEVAVHIGIIGMIHLHPSSYKLDIMSCGKVDCENYGKELHSNFCPVCGGNINMLPVNKYGVVKWEDFMESRDWEDEDILNPFPHGPEEKDGFQILTHDTWSKDEPSIDIAGEGDIIRIEDLEKHKPMCIAKFELEHADFIKDAKEFFGSKFSYDYGITSYWSG